MYPESLRPPVLSICLTTFNRARYLDSLLADLAARTGELGCSYELLIGDNASNDDTADVVSRYEHLLNIHYFRRPENVGGARNLSQLFDVAQGRYVVYLADDDLLIPSVLGRYIAYLEDHPDVGAIFAPWLLHDRVLGQDNGVFYHLDNEYRIDPSDHVSLFNLLMNNHIFPEIYVARKSLVREAWIGANHFAFFHFVNIAAMVDRTAVLFSREPFYRQVIRYFEGESRAQEGHAETKSGWDRYRGGAEYLLARFASRISAEDLAWAQRAIDGFARARMSVGLRVRTDEGGTWIDNYFIANRLRCAGDDSLLPAPYEIYRIYAALEFLINLQPFYPQRATVAYYKDDPPEVLTQASDFLAAGLVVLEDRSRPLPENVILLINHKLAPTNSSAYVISEAELLAKFP